MFEFSEYAIKVDRTVY